MVFLEIGGGHPPKYSQYIPEKHICAHFPKSKKSVSCLNRFFDFPKSGSWRYFEVCISGSNFRFWLNRYEEKKEEKRRKEKKEEEINCYGVDYIKHTKRTRARAPLRVRPPKGADSAAVPEVLWAAEKNHFPISKKAHFPKWAFDGMYSGMVLELPPGGIGGAHQNDPRGVFGGLHLELLVGLKISGGSWRRKLRLIHLKWLIFAWPRLAV